MNFPSHSFEIFKIPNLKEREFLELEDITAQTPNVASNPITSIPNNVDFTIGEIENPDYLTNILKRIQNEKKLLHSNNVNINSPLTDISNLTISPSNSSMSMSGSVSMSMSVDQTMSDSDYESWQ
eukprot:TRINITY_DN2566_c0_g3_i1.p1 TRINITY_DN2566_c0_g3~~TRINITY_DN2566_c0_g3_i1.p1  ORF type:complete len:125 (+),score=31.83 TRINITY_DN2566_c0_g3_i1:83-457(+)